jgi:hypothetical protein
MKLKAKSELVFNSLELADGGPKHSGHQGEWKLSLISLDVQLITSDCVRKNYVVP